MTFRKLFSVYFLKLFKIVYENSLYEKQFDFVLSFVIEIAYTVMHKHLYGNCLVRLFIQTGP